MDGYDWNGLPASPYESLSPSQYLSFLLASADPNSGDNRTGSVAPDFLSVRRSQSQSIGSGNSPHQSGISAPVSNPQPPSASSSRHPLSPITVNNCRPPPPPEQQSSQTPTLGKTQSLVTRGSRFSPSLWESHRAKIKELFMDNDKSLDETMEFMATHFLFSPSRKQYNTKLKQWGFIKNISGTTASWMVNKARARKRQGLKTTFTVGGRPLTMDRIERSAKRAKSEGIDVSVIDIDTPPDVRYSTPDNGAPPTHKTAPSEEKWTPSQTFHAARPTFLHLKWDGKTKVDLENIYREAQVFARMGNFGDAEERYLQTLGGYEALLSPTHEDTIEVAYEFAEFYARNDRMDDADKVIDWMGDKHMERWPVSHKRIRAHLIRVADMLYSWSRAEDAVSILSRAAHIYNKSFQPQSANSRTLQGLQEHTQSQSMRDEHRKTARFSGEEPPQQEEGGNSIRVDYDTILAVARAHAEGDEAEALLLSLLEQCERQPGKLPVQILEARCALVELYKSLEMPDKVDEALGQVDKSFWAVFKSEAKRTKLLLDAAIEVVSLLVKAERFLEAEPMFGKIEMDVVKAFGEDDGVTISILIQIGNMFQTHKRWVDARPRFEELRQLSLVMRVRPQCLGHGNAAMFLLPLMFQY